MTISVILLHCSSWPSRSVIDSGRNGRAPARASDLCRGGAAGRGPVPLSSPINYYYCILFLFVSFIAYHTGPPRGFSSESEICVSSRNVAKTRKRSRCACDAREPCRRVRPVLLVDDDGEQRLATVGRQRADRPVRVRKSPILILFWPACQIAARPRSQRRLVNGNEPNGSGKTDDD